MLRKRKTRRYSDVRKNRKRKIKKERKRNAYLFVFRVFDHPARQTRRMVWYAVRGTRHTVHGARTLRDRVRGRGLRTGRMRRDFIDQKRLLPFAVAIKPAQSRGRNGGGLGPRARNLNFENFLRERREEKTRIERARFLSIRSVQSLEIRLFRVGRAGAVWGEERPREGEVPPNKHGRKDRGRGARTEYRAITCRNKLAIRHDFFIGRAKTDTRG